MSGIRPEETARILIARHSREDEEAQLRASRLRAQIRAVVPAIARRLGVRRVFLFGSLVWGPVFPDSDIDLSIEGGSGAIDDAFAAALWEQVEASVDVVALDRAPTSLRERILADGEIIYSFDGVAE